MENLNEIICDTFEDVIKSYEQMLKSYYPSNKSNGFTERNLTFNFAHYYKKMFNHVVIWQEANLYGNNEHIDTLIIDDTKKSIILIEAKRLNTKKKYLSLIYDAKRLNNSYKRLASIDGYIKKQYRIYGLLLFDHWNKTEKGVKYNRFTNVFESINSELEVNVLSNLRKIENMKNWSIENYYISYVLFEIKI